MILTIYFYSIKNILPTKSQIIPLELEPFAVALHLTPKKKQANKKQQSTHKKNPLRKFIILIAE